MPLFQYQPDHGSQQQSNSHPRQAPINNHSHTDNVNRAGQSTRTAASAAAAAAAVMRRTQREPSWGIGNDNDDPSAALDYDLQAALEIEEAESAQYATEHDFYEHHQHHHQHHHHHQPVQRQAPPAAAAATAASGSSGSSRPRDVVGGASKHNNDNHRNAKAPSHMDRKHDSNTARTEVQAAPSQPPRTAEQSRKGKARAVEVDGFEDDDSDVDMIPVITNARPQPGRSGDIEQLTREIDSIDEQIASLKAARALLVDDRSQLLKQQEATKSNLREQQQQAERSRTSQARPSGGVVNYSDSKQFSWKKKLDGILDRVFGIKQLRLCQEGVLNAVLDGRDVICIMPTGGGKSVCFQAPALMTQGVTLVISPLLSLMADQVIALNQKGVEAVMITGSSSQAEIKDITQRLTSSDGNIKLCYVTPEKLARSKTFANTLSKMYAAGLLGRIAIDESHCCSQMGHDFRPDYKKLSMLKQLYPDTPIIALTATCGKAVLNDVVRILHLKACTAGESAEPYKTVFFSAPLYRPNLHYSVRVKSAQAQGLAVDMADEIMTRYPDSAGIIYCLSQKETETFALAIREQTDGKVKIGTYHAGMEDAAKERIHLKWRKGEIKCVVATIAFGMGIDAPDVRYVFHQTISKSMEGYYQETGRAGRDGKASDCILWFRSADASRLSTLTLGEVEGSKKLHNMLKYALDYTTCRKLLFDSYFGNPANVVAPFAESDRTDCGHCDNCLRKLLDERAEGDAEPSSSSPEKGNQVDMPEGASSAITEYIAQQSVTTRDATMEAWKVCKIIRAADEVGSRITLPGAADLCRGLAKATFPTKEKNTKATLDLDALCGGKITSISKDDMEILLLELLMKGFLREDYVQTAYTINSYIVTGPQSIRLSRLRPEQVPTSGISIELTTVGPRAKKSKGKGKGKDSSPDEDDGVNDEEGADSEGQQESKTKPAKRQPRKRKSSVEGKSDTKGSGSKETSASAKSKGKGKGIGKEKNQDQAHDTSVKRRRKATSDSEDWEDLGFGSSTMQASLNTRPSAATTSRHTSTKDRIPNMDLSENSETDSARYQTKQNTAPARNGARGAPIQDVIDLDSTSDG